MLNNNELLKMKSNKNNLNTFINPEELQLLDLSQNELKTIRYTPSVKPFSNFTSLNLENNNLSELDDIKFANFPKLSEIGISWNWLSCEYATELLHQWSNLQIVGNPCDQNAIDGENENNREESKLFIVLGISLGSIFVCATIATIFVKRRKLSKDEGNSEKQIDLSSNNYNAEPIYEEPIYYEIEPIEQKYDHLSFGALQLSAFKSHYHNATSS